MLRHILKHWKTTIALKYSPFGSTPPHIPSGFLAVYVGQDRIRFLIPVGFLHCPIFIALLQQAEEEYGFKFSGGMVLPCEVGFFMQVLRFLHKDENKYGRLDEHQLLNLIFETGSSSNCKLDGHFSFKHGLIHLMHKSS